MVVGLPGTGKTTLGNQLAFNHAAAGGRAVVATLLTETHDLMLANLAGFRFFDPALVGERVTYLNLFDALEREGLEGVIGAIRQLTRETGATLLIVDGATVFEDMAVSPLVLRGFSQQLQAQTAVLGATGVLLTAQGRDQLGMLGAHVDAVVTLANERESVRHVRQLEVIKLRGGSHIGGVHAFAIDATGLTVYPRLESVAGDRRSRIATDDQRLGTGTPGLDAMLGGGLLPLSSTLVMGPPGAGKTLLGLGFLVEGTNRGERGLLAGFHETAPELVTTAAGIGLDLGDAIEAGDIRLLWDPPLEISPDAWAWRLLDTVREHRPQRVFIDALTDIQRLITGPQRIPPFVTALTNELRALGTTTLVASEIDAYVDQELAVPVPAVSAAIDTGILLRQVEFGSSLRRLVSILKARQVSTDPTIREFVIDARGITVGDPLVAATGLLTGSATPSHLPPAGTWS
jgi:circadian clock protein KaiC